ncbi:hypothetical protein CK203_041911 [Vitis vinifera]|uniref:Uncharacterized protein n=1 Tax=Vitis vinifera TaxID=29760 RepID=A0A438FY70_VITVI|nr:hypothetical protein CK203_041911 [Vitis vinifera]
MSHLLSFKKSMRRDLVQAGALILNSDYYSADEGEPTAPLLASLGEEEPGRQMLDMHPNLPISNYCRCRQAHAPSPFSLLPLRRRKPLLHHLPPPLPRNDRSAALTLGLSSRRITCKATEVSVAEEPSAAGDGENWVPVVPLSALPKGERRVIIQDGETILLL